MKKSSVIQFSRNRGPDQIPIIAQVNETILEPESEVKYLGLFIDQHLTWKSHIDYVCNQVSSGLYLLRSTAQLRNLTVMKMIYHAIIESRLRYGIAVWGGAAQYLMKRVFVLQKRAVRILAGLRSRQSCRAAFQQLSLLTLSGLYMLEVIVYARFDAQVPRGQHVHDYNTRARHDLRQEQHRSQLAGTLPQNIGAALFNRLPDALRRVGDRAKFRAGLKEYLTEGVFYSVREFSETHREAL